MPGMPTEQPPEVDVDEEGSPLNPEEGVLHFPVAEKQGKDAEAPVAGKCEDVFCETMTVEESSLMQLSEAEREVQLKKIGIESAAAGR